MKEYEKKELQLEELVLVKLQKLNFKRKRKHYYIRKVNHCIQNFVFQVTKVKGRDECHLYVGVGFTFPAINEIISLLKGIEYDKTWVTSQINMDSLVHSDKVYGFIIDEFSNIEEMAEDIVEKINSKAVLYWESCDTVKKYQKMLIDKDDLVRRSTAKINGVLWNFLACLIILDDESYDSFIDENREYFGDDNSLKKSISNMTELIDKIKGGLYE